MDTAPTHFKAAPNPKRRSGRSFAIGVVLGALVLFGLIPVITGRNVNFELQLIILALYYVTLASSWNILGGYTEYISLGHNAFAAIGGYFSGILLLYHGIPVFATAIFAGIVAMLVAFVFGFITLRIRRGPAFIISTIAFVLILELVLDNWRYVNGSNGINLPFLEIPVTLSKLPYYYIFLLLAAITVYVSYRIRRSKLGLGLRAISQDEVKAESAGIPTNYLKILAFAISGFFVGIAGSLWAQYLTYITPGIYLEVLIGTRIVLMCILGGKGTVSGPVVGAVLYVAFDELIRSQFGGTEFNIALTGAVLLIAILFFPEGIVGTLHRRGKLPTLLNWDD
jgi:branched-chain amino acid transport system permease protein